MKTPEENIKNLSQVGVDFLKALKRTAGNEEILLKQYTKFVNYENRFAALTTKLATSDLEGLKNELHTLKGVCGNLEVRSLYEKIIGIEDNIDRINKEHLIELLSLFKEVKKVILESTEDK